MTSGISEGNHVKLCKLLGLQADVDGAEILASVTSLKADADEAHRARMSICSFLNKHDPRGWADIVNVICGASVSDWADLMASADEVVATKGRDYLKGSKDRVANFREAGEDAGITPLQAWYVFWSKHVNAIASFVKTGGQHESEPVFGRFVDVLNYTRLGWILAREVVEARDGLKPKHSVVVDFDALVEGLARAAYEEEAGEGKWVMAGHKEALPWGQVHEPHQESFRIRARGALAFLHRRPLVSKRGVGEYEVVLPPDEGNVGAGI